jgi:putative mRNA 3-end processing factor
VTAVRGRSRPAIPCAVTWRDGVHLVGTAIWCDARRVRGVCFASSADAQSRVGPTNGDRDRLRADARPARRPVGHGQLIASAETLALLGAGDAHLASPFGRPFTLGTTRLELVPSGHGQGGAGLAANVGGRPVFYAGAHNPAGGGRGVPGELRPCETLVLVAPWGEPHHRFPPPAEATRRLVDACGARADDAAAVVLVDDAIGGLELAALLHAHGVAVAGHRAIVDGARRLAEAGLEAPPLRRAIARGRALVWPLADVARLPAALRGLRAHRLLASGLACEPGFAASVGADVGVAWSLAGDRDAALGLVGSARATEVVLLGDGAAPLAAAIGPRARVLGPPRQMPLFAAVS